MIPSRKCSSFTLVEMVAAMSVLIIMGVIFVQMTAMTSSTIRLSNRAVDASSQASLAFDRIRIDLNALVKRPDVDFIAMNPTNTQGNVVGAGNIMLFLAGVSSAGTTSSANRGISMVAYQISTNSDNGGLPCLLRAGKPIGWNNSGFMGLTATNGPPISFNSSLFPTALMPSTTNTPSDFDVLAPGVINMVVGFQLYPDNQTYLNVTPPLHWTTTYGWTGSSTTSTNAVGQMVYYPPLTNNAGVYYIDATRIAALVVGVVALDVNSLRQISPPQATATQQANGASELTALATNFPLPAYGTTPLQSWTSVADGLATNSSLTGIPLPVRQAVHVYQEAFPLTPYGTKGY